MTNKNLTDKEIEEEFLNRRSFKDKIAGINSEEELKVQEKISDVKLTEEKQQIQKGQEQIVEENKNEEQENPKEASSSEILEDKHEEVVVIKNEQVKVKENTENITTKSSNSESKFPKDFLWGVSTSAYQIEGGNHNDWSVWEKSEKRKKSLKKKKLNIADFICGDACDSYNRYKEDLDLVKGLGCNAYRFSLEWSRIQPKKGTWNISVIKHYKKQLREAKERGLKTVVTIWHWTNPTWIAEEGGWKNKKTVKYFVEYAKMVTRELDVYVDYWVTLNEPTIPLINGYLTRRFPPNKRGLISLFKAMNNLAKAHNYTYEIIQKYFKTPTSVVIIANYYEPAHKWNLLEVGIAKLAKYFGTTMFLNKIKGNFDFIAFDYYFHDRFVWYPPFKKNKNEKVTDMGWEIYPEGIYHVLKELAEYKKPLMICENGIADAEDKYRADFIRDHVKHVQRAIDEGVDVRGYFYWSLLDNFEWDNGWAPKFGLYKVDPKTFERTERPSAQVYRDIIKNNGA